jgi:outer membrane protein insertion porin family/translocation and assembly module TamA
MSGAPSIKSASLVRRWMPLSALLWIRCCAMCQLSLLRRLLVLPCAVGCANVPAGHYALDRVYISGNVALTNAELEAQIATRESPRFLGVVTGLVYHYEIFDRYVLERDLRRIERHCRSRGYYWSRVRAARVFNTGPGKVSVEIVVDEGTPSRVGRLDIRGVDTLPSEVRKEAVQAVEAKLVVGERFEEADFDAASEALRRVLMDHGHAYAAVRRAADVDIPSGAVSAGFWVDAGPTVRLGDIHISGLGDLSEDPVRRAMRLSPGQPYSRSDLAEAQRALLDLGVFSAASVDPVLEQSAAKTPREVVPVEVKLQTSRFRSAHAGLGVQVDSQRTDAHVLAGWEDHNFLGGIRYLFGEFLAGEVIYPTLLPELAVPRRLLPEGRLRLDFRQPGLVEGITDGFVRVQGSLGPVLLSSSRDRRDPVLGYRGLGVSVGLERTFYGRAYAALSHNVQISNPFSYVGALAADLETAVVSYPELLLRFDARNDPLDTRSGVYLSNTLQFAGVGGGARDVKIQPQARGYVPVGPMTFAAGGSVGFVFPRNYGSTVANNAFTGQSGTNRAAWVRDVQLMYLRGFFGGGPGSNRGYAPREIGPHGAVPFYIPGANDAQISRACNTSDPRSSTGISCDLPIGGFSLWQASAELRFALHGPLRGALFTDLADASPYQLDVRLNRPHLAVGFGLRFSTPVGPLRADIGYRVPGLQTPRSEDESRPSELFGLPIALSFGIGEPL